MAQTAPARRRRRWGFSRGQSLRKPAGEEARIEADYVGAGWARIATHNAMLNASETPSDAESTIQLAQFLKLQGLVGTGGEAKVLVQRGDVRVNGTIETRRGRRLRPGDQVELAGSIRVVPSKSDES